MSYIGYLNSGLIVKPQENINYYFIKIYHTDPNYTIKQYINDEDVIVEFLVKKHDKLDMKEVTDVLKTILIDYRSNDIDWDYDGMIHIAKVFLQENEIEVLDYKIITIETY